MALSMGMEILSAENPLEDTPRSNVAGNSTPRPTLYLALLGGVNRVALPEKRKRVGIEGDKPSRAQISPDAGEDLREVSVVDQVVDDIIEEKYELEPVTVKVAWGGNRR